MKREFYSIKGMKTFVKIINVYDEAINSPFSKKLKGPGINKPLSVIYETDKGNYLLSGGTYWLLNDYMDYLKELGEITNYVGICNILKLITIPNYLKKHLFDKKSYIVYVIDLENSEIRYEIISSENIKEARNKAKIILREELHSELSKKHLNEITVRNLKDKHAFVEKEGLNENFTNYRFIIGCEKI